MCSSPMRPGSESVGKMCSVVAPKGFKVLALKIPARTAEYSPTGASSLHIRLNQHSRI